MVITEKVKVYNSNEYLLYMVRDLCLYRLWKSNPKSQTKHHHYILVKYGNRLLDQINSNKIIHSSQSFYIFPASKYHLLNTGVTFKYGNTIRAKVTNYKETVNNVNRNVTCACKDYQEFIDNHHGHVITGDLNIIHNIDIRKLLAKGLNFREKQPLNATKANRSAQSAIDTYIGNISNVTKIQIKLFSPWKTFVLDKVKSMLQNAHKHPVTTILNKKENKDYLDLFHSQFVLVPVDKAGNNIGIICKTFYLNILYEEITESGNFEPSNTTFNEITSNYTDI